MNGNDRIRPVGPGQKDAGISPAELSSAIASGGTGGAGVGSPGDVGRESANTDALTAGAAVSGVAAPSGDLPNTSAIRRQGALPAWTAEDARLADFARIEPGWAVVGCDAEPLGKVLELGPAWFSLRYGVRGEHTMYVPPEFIETVAGTRVVLSQPAGLLIDMKLNAPPTVAPVQVERISGVAHDVRRAETGDTRSIPEPSDLTAQSPLPPVVPAVGSAEPATSQVSGGPALATAQPGVDWGQIRPPQVNGGFRAVEGAPASAPEDAERARSVVSTRMDPSPVTADGTDRDRVNSHDLGAGGFEQRTGYSVLSGEERRDGPGGPTHQPGVMSPASLEPLRTQFGETGTVGEGRERNPTDLDLRTNRHDEGSAFDSQAATVGRPLAPGEPSAANRSLEQSAGRGVGPHTGAADVPRGSVSRPEATS